ncbi:SpaA isopeptide-forming pilin-related protein [Gemmiger formicilis]|uniref:SpaA isopeptide-forming pilin-related protein n=1 Tax=Gemmiger formicilis TaxID=745368 RepID=UPI0035202CCE
MTKAFSILHRAAALLVALCLLVGMALPVYAAEDGALFFDAGSETIPTTPAANTSSEGVEPAQEPIVSDLETIPGEGDTPPTANEPGTEAGNTVNNTAAVPNNDGKTQEAAENQTPAAATDTAPADPALTNKTPADTPETAAAPNHAINAEKTTAAKTNTEQDVLFADGDNPNEEDTMFADDLPDNDDANTPDTIADTSVSTGFIPATTTIYFEDDGRYDSTYNGNCTMRFLGFTGNGKEAYINKVMVDTGTTVTGKDGKNHRIFSITLNSADYPAGGFYRIAFQYYDGSNSTWQEEINAFGRDDGVNNDYLTAIDLLAGKKFVREGIEIKDKPGTHYNQNQSYTPAQWTRVEYYYKDTPLYFKNASDAALTDVTATFYKLENGATAQTGSQTIGTVDAGKLAAQQIRIPDNQSRFVQFSWNDGQSALYDFTTDFTTSPYADAKKLDLTAANCYVYNDTTSAWASAGGDLLTAGKKIYFDATLSAYSYEGEGLQQSAMGDGETMYCFLTGSDGVKSLTMTQETDPTAADRKLWSCTIPAGTYTAVQFSATDNQDAPARDNKTRKYSTAEISPTLQDPCFFADDGDPSAYTGGEGVNRDGYWGEKASVRDAESGKNTTVVDIASGEFKQVPGTKYITSTLYDYYTDYELNGLNRDTYPDSTTSSQRGFVTFEQFNRALSSAYTANNNVKYPLYTGHFQPSIGGWANPFATVAAGMKLYGWSNDTNSPAYNTFMAVNNSALDDSGNGSDDYNRTFQGLVESKTSDGMANGLPLLRTKNSTTNASVDPHFDKDFLQGKNAFNTVLGKVYEDVSFPLKQKAVFAQDPNCPADNDPEGKAKYWYYDSNETSLYLKHGSARQSYYLAGDGINEASHNRDAGNKTDNMGYGFFPFNETVTGSASQYNYGFGAKLQFDFTLTEDGNVVVGKDNDGNDIKVPIKFFFSGDDDVWVYIDGELVLDVGGAHGKASGLLEFGANNTVTPYVSSNKNTNTSDPMVYKGYQSGETAKTVNYNGQPITFNKKGTTKTLENQSTHTLTMYYMERGMWESNMALAFNFPDHNELQVEKQVDVSDVNPLFRDSFKNQKIFTFNIQNLATHYKAKETDEPAIETYKLPDTVYSSATGLRYVSPLPEDVDKDRGSAVLWSSDKSDPSSLYRNQRRGTLTWDSAINISPYSYLTFDAYVQGNQTDTCALSNLYVELWDTSGKQMGCLGTKGLQSSDVYGAATALHPGQWYTVRLMLNSLKQVEGFDKTQLKSITVGDNYARNIYLRNFTFSSAPTLPKQTGFTTAQYDVPDYGSAESGKLENAAYAVFSSNLGNGDVVDENGRFLLQDGETVTFNDQFRRGSYIALREQIDPELYDTTWTVYENGVPVTSVNGKTGVVDTGDVNTLQNVSGTAPNDDRTEQVVNTTLDGYNTKNEYTEAQKPNAGTLVFRSYSNSADDNELTKLKVVFNNKVKTGKLIIRKVPAKDETLENQEFTFTVQFVDVGGQSLGDTIEQQTYTCTVKQHGDEYYGEIVIDKIPVGTRFVVSENEKPGTSLKSVHIDGGKDCAVAADGVKVYGAIAEGEANAATATFENTARELIDITVKKEWKTQDGKADIPQADLPNAIYLQLQRTETPDEADSWLPVSGYKSVELKKPDGYEGWTKQFTGLDKYDANKAGNDHVAYTYRVLESATETGQFYGGAEGDVIEINGKKYKVHNTTVTGNSADKTLTLTNQLQNAKYKLVITKQDAQDPNTKLGGVEFKLEKPDAELSETKTGKTAEETGELTFADLTPGSYRLTETKTAEGYTLLAEPIEFTLTADGRCLRGDETFVETTAGADGVYNIALTVYNRKGFTLPHTGADAPSLWLLIGLPALVAVLLVLVFRYNKKGGKHS